MGEAGQGFRQAKPAGMDSGEGSAVTRGDARPVLERSRFKVSANSACWKSLRRAAEQARRFVNAAILWALDNSDGDIVKARKQREAWYDSTMDRVSGWYKRQTHRRQPPNGWCSS